FLYVRRLYVHPSGARTNDERRKRSTMLPQANRRLNRLLRQTNMYGIYTDIDYDKQTKRAILCVYLLLPGEPQPHSTPKSPHTWSSNATDIVHSDAWFVFDLPSVPAR